MGAEFCQRLFLHLLRWSYSFVNVVYHTDLQILKNPCVPGINPTWSWYMIFLMGCWIWFVSIWWRISGLWLGVFNHKLVLNFVKGFLCIYWNNHMVFIFQFVKGCITLIDLWILKNPCIPGIKPIWSLCMIFLICCWILFAIILLRIFASMFISDIGL